MSSDTTIQLENLVEQARGGNQQAFEALYQQTYRLVYFHAKSITKNEEEAPGPGSGRLSGGLQWPESP